MSFTSGVFSLVAGNPVVTGTTISSTWANNTLNDIATGLSTCVLKDGTQTMTGNIPMATFKLTGLGAGTAAGNSIRWEQVLDTTGLTLTGPLNEVHGADIASAATVNLTTATGNVVDVTGTVTVTAITLAEGYQRWVRFTGALILTNGASLALPGGANITTAAGDYALFIGYAAGVVRCAQYLKISGAPAVGTGVPRSYLAGLTLSTAGSSATMSVAAGQAADSTNAVVMSLAASISKTTSSWSVGSAAGGLDTGAIANSTWYHFYEIMRPDTGVVDVVFSLSASAPTMPANYTYKRRLGSGLTNGSAQWVAFTQDGDLFQWTTPVSDVAANNPGITAVTPTLTVPTGVNVIHRGIWSLQDTDPANASALYVTAIEVTDAAATTARSQTALAASAAGRATDINAQLDTRTNTSAQVRYRLFFSNASVSVNELTLGWIDRRGRDS